MPDEGGAATQALPGVKRASDQSERYREAMDKIRARTDATSKGLAAVGTAAIGGIGYAKLADVFPYEGPCWALALLFGGVLTMLVVVFAVVRLFGRASQTVVTSADAETTIAANPGFDEKEKALVRDKYAQMGALNGAESLAAYQARAHRFERIAERGECGDPATVAARAELIYSEVAMTQARVGALIIRGRANGATVGPALFVCIALFVAGWYMTALSADALESKRSGEAELVTKEVELAKACAEARALPKVVPGKIPETCGEAPVSAPGEEPSASAAGFEALTALAAALEKCAGEAGDPSAACRKLERASAAATLP